jgi:hypothetical protein
MAISDKNTIIRLTAAKKITSICLIMACFILAIASSNNLQVADAHKSSDKPDVEFIRQFGTSDVDSAEDVFADSSGVYVVGFTDNTLPGQTSEGSRDAFIRKYNSDGDEIWTRQFGTSDNDEARGVSVDSSGVYVVGETQGTFSGQSDEGGLEAFIRKYNSDGDEIWTRQFGTSLQDNAFAVSAESSGVYVVGITRGEFEGESSAGGFDAFIRKYNSDGDEIWTRQFGTSDDFDSANDVFADSTGVYIAGNVGDSLPGQTSEGSIDAFIRKYNSDGDEIWTRQFGTPGRDAANGVSADSSGVYVAGFTQQEDDIGSDDAFIRKYNSDGDEIWTRQFGTSDNDEARGVSVDSSGVYVAGVTTGTFQGESSAGDADIFIRKYNSDGDEIWTRQFGSSEFDFINNGVSVDSSGVYVAGQTSGTLPGQTSEGDEDAFLAKLSIDDDDKKHDDDRKKDHDDDAKKKG